MQKSLIGLQFLKCEYLSNSEFFKTWSRNASSDIEKEEEKRVVLYKLLEKRVLTDKSPKQCNSLVKSRNYCPTDQNYFKRRKNYLFGETNDVI